MTSSGAQRSRAKKAPPEEGAALLDEIRTSITSFMVMTPAESVAVTLWCAFTHVHDVMSVSPLLRITSAESGSGKTNLAQIVSALVRNALSVTSATAAVIYRQIEHDPPTLIFDECDMWLTHNPTLVGILNGGHYRSMAYVLRCEGRDHTPRRLSTWCPKVVCGLDRLANTTESRCIHITLRRKLPTEVCREMRWDREHALFAAFGKRLSRWARAARRALPRIDPTSPAELANRAVDNWRPLFAIADFAEGEWPRMAREAAIALTPGSRDDDSRGIRLLRAMANAVARWQADELQANCAGIPTETLLREINEDERRRAMRDPLLTSISLAIELRKHDLHSRNVRWRYLYSTNDIRTAQSKGYLLNPMCEVFRRYVPDVFVAPEPDEDDPETNSNSHSQPSHPSQPN